jgi:hydrogenase-4 component B
MGTTVPFALVLCFALCGAGALMGILTPERRIPSLLAWTGSLAAAAAFCGAGAVLVEGAGFRSQLWTIRSVGTITVSVDSISAFFLLLASVVVLASSIFSAGYLRRYAGHYSLRSFNAWYLLLVASIVWILIEGDVLGFLLAWEAMSITSYFLVNFEHEREGTSHSGYLMLAMGEAGFIAVGIALLFLAARVGAPDFSALKLALPGLGPAARWAVFLLTFFGFGVKAGLTPVNSWLPRAHPAAPANVSAILSGVILNLGLYGIVRINLDLVPVTDASMGVIVLVTGVLSALVGILYATTESDLKALLAHSSIENIGIVTMGFGAAIVFSAYDRPILAGIALIAGFYHLMNHSLYKALLFLGAGVVDQQAGTRDLDRLGGLSRVMPYTAAAFLAGSLAISALPPFNGLTSEWLTLQSLLRTAELPSPAMRLLFALCGAGLALTAALAVTCFVKAFAMGFLGKSRTHQAAAAGEPPKSEVVPMAMLALLCLMLGVLPTYIIPALNRALAPIVSPGATTALVPAFFSSNPAHHELPPAFVADFHRLGAQTGESVLAGRGLVILHRGGPENPVVFAMSPAYAFVALALFLFTVWFVVRRSTARRSVARRELWAGGIPHFLPEMAYSATGFSNPVRVVFNAVFRPNIVEDTRQTVAVHFRTAIRRRQKNVYFADSLFFLPLGDAVIWLAKLFAGMHHGRLNAYVGYSLGFLLVILVVFRFS